MYWLQIKSNSLHCQKCHFLKRFQMLSIIQLVVITVSLVSAQMQYPKNEKDVLVQKDDNILLSNKFLPFLDGCSTADAPIEICSMYYDMVYNVYNLELNGKEIKQSILEANQILDKLTATFCNIFRNESKNALDKQPFSTANNITNISEWIRMNGMCELNCMDYKRRVILIKDVCKFISGGFRSILKEKKKKYDLIHLPLSGPGNGNEDTNTKRSNEKKQQNSEKDKVTIDQTSNQTLIQKTIPTYIDKTVAKAPSNVVRNTTTNTNSNHNNSNLTSPKSLETQPKTSESIKQLENSAPAAQSPPQILDVTPKLEKNITNNVDVNKKLKNINDNVNTNEQTANKQTSASSVDIANGDEENDKNLNDLSYNDDNAAEDEDTDPQQDLEPHVVNGENFKNTDIDSNNNLKQSRLEADQVAFREDTESSFFPYFMFLMFVIVTLYVAYHNKSKILALMIEGRRSRNYSSRSGNRRKHSSAEYRKLDSNLEEAIQSDGHVLSTQIIY